MGRSGGFENDVFAINFVASTDDSALIEEIQESFDLEIEPLDLAVQEVCIQPPLNSQLSFAIMCEVKALGPSWI